MKNKVSFDFDCTLDKYSVQEYAKELIERGFEVWICTARLSPEESQQGWNDDLFKVADDVGIKREHIIFTAYKDKVEVLSNDFIFHLDDDWFELKALQRKSKIKAISSFGNNKWRQKCDKAIRESQNITHKGNNV